MNIFPFLHLRETKYIRLSPRLCQGCWECVEVCPAGVLIKMDRAHRGHVHIRNPDACTGCKKCVRACKNAAIEYTYVPGSAQSSWKHVPEEEL